MNFLEHNSNEVSTVSTYSRVGWKWERKRKIFLQRVKAQLSQFMLIKMSHDRARIFSLWEWTLISLIRPGEIQLRMLTFNLTSLLLQLDRQCLFFRNELLREEDDWEFLFYLSSFLLLWRRYLIKIFLFASCCEKGVMRIEWFDVLKMSEEAWAKPN